MIRKRERERERERESATVDLQQASINADATSTAGEEAALIFNDQRRGKKGQQSTAEKRGELARERERPKHGISCKGQRPIA
jgi:hypothetical protein